MAKILRFSDEAMHHLWMHAHGLISFYSHEHSRALASNGISNLVNSLMDYVIVPLTGLEPNVPKPEVAAAVFNNLEQLARLLGEEHEGVAIWSIKATVVVKCANTGAALLPPEVMSVNFQGSAFQSDTDQVVIDGRKALVKAAELVFQKRMEESAWFSVLVLEHIKDVNDWTVELTKDSITLVN